MEPQNRHVEPAIYPVLTLIEMATYRPSKADLTSEIFQRNSNPYSRDLFQWGIRPGGNLFLQAVPEMVDSLWLMLYNRRWMY